MSRELDLAIAKALGHEIDHGYKYIEVKMFDGGGYRWYSLPYYSTDGNTMLELDREMRKREWCIILEKNEKGYWNIIYKNTNNEYIYTSGNNTDTEPLARALAAHHVLTGKEWEGNK